MQTKSNSLADWQACNYLLSTLFEISATLFEVLAGRKIAIKNLAILQTCDLPAILRYRRIFAPHRIGDIRLVAKMSSALSGRQLAGFPKNQCLFLGLWSMVCLYIYTSHKVYGNSSTLSQCLVPFQYV